MQLKWTLYYVIWLELVNLVFLIEALKAGEKGVCTVTISVQKTRSRWVTINKRCGKKKCTVKKIEKYSAPQQQTICCSGWEYNSIDTCSPICQPGCQGGQCTAPNECTCDPPSTHHTDQKNICLSPKCDLSCVNADCVNNKCLCRPGFQIYNLTHCSNCGPGFSTTEDLKCVPKCEGGCLNGKCTGPNECTCDEGYESNEFDVCVPVCTKPCKNGKCSAPDICTCDEGYQNGTDYCEPICTQPCINAKCTEPEICTCHEGYQKNDRNYCEPICSQPCTNGKCTKPEICTCKEGYQKNETDYCEPICTQPCTNGKCTEPEICTCHEGYQKNGTNYCEPICTPPCTNGKCTEVNVCTCDSGFEKNATNVCVPKCTNCNNGKCTEPDICTCNIGFTKSISGLCEPKCECVNSTCVAPNKCSCFDGFEKLNDTVCVPKCDKCSGVCVGPNVCVCAEGLVNTDGECKTVCGDCENGHCVGDDCVCNEGFVAAGDLKRCVRDCMLPVIVNQTLPKNFPEKFSKAKMCPSGYKDCTPKETQELGRFDPKRFRCCYKRKMVEQKLVLCCGGYQYLKEKKICQPICNPSCEHGTCVEPNKCQCDQLYSWHDKKCVPSVCNPICGSNTLCTNDTCNCIGDTIPYNTTHCIPKCNPGYDVNKISLACEPHCESACQNGKCVGPNTCNCHEGYQSVNGSCIPVCYECANGDCISPNVCQCHEPDYTKHANGSCVPVCTAGCVNADCTAPNFCTCHSGYNKTDQHNLFKCQPICDRKCVNATCVSPNSCSCFDGYEAIRNEWTCALKCDEGYVRNASDPITCYKPCKGPCEFGVCTRDGVCECRGGYELVNDTCSLLTPVAVDCSSCGHSCSNGECWCEDGRTCTSTPELGAEVASPGLAAMELTWGLGGALVLLLLALVMGVMFHLYRRRRPDTKATTSDPFGSVVYTVPDTLLTQKCPNLEKASESTEANEATEANEYEASEANGNVERLLSQQCEP